MNKLISMMGFGPGNIGNRIFMYWYCRMLQNDFIPEFDIVNFSIPELGIYCRKSDIVGRTLEIKDGHRHSMSEIAYLINNGIYDNIYFHGFVQRMEYYKSRNFLSSLLPEPILSKKIDDNCILINIRGSEILKAIHPDYVPIPISFIEQIIKETNLHPVFCGQLGDDFYSNEIRNRFSYASFIKNKTAREDFDIIRMSKNVLLSVSTFSWIAAWISNTAQNIYMPLIGFYNPKQRSDIDLIPLRDKRYNFYEFPIIKWQNKIEQLDFIINGGSVFNKINTEKLMDFIEYKR